MLDARIVRKATLWRERGILGLISRAEIPLPRIGRWHGAACSSAHG